MLVKQPYTPWYNKRDQFYNQKQQEKHKIDKKKKIEYSIEFKISKNFI